MRVIPDVDVNAERSDKQKEESSKFGFLSDFINKNLEFFKLGFPKAYQPLNTAIKVNRENVNEMAEGYEIDFPKFIFSEGKLAPVSITDMYNYTTFTSQHFIRVNFRNDYPNGDSTDKILVIYKIIETGEIIFYPRKDSEMEFIRIRGDERCYTGVIDQYRNKHIAISIMLYNGKEASRTIYCGTIQAKWN